VADLTIEDVGEIKKYLSETCTEVNRWLPGTGWNPAWRSEARREIDNQERRADGNPWGDTPVRTAYAASAVFLFAVLDCLAAMADSIDILTTAYMPNVLGRAAMEAASQAWWLLQPRIGVRCRVARAVAVRASSGRNLGKAVRKLDPLAPVTNYGEDLLTVRTYAAGLGLTLVCNDSTTTCGGETLPSYTARAEEFERVAIKTTAAYRIYSAAAHAELYSVMQSWRQAQPGSPSGATLERCPDREAVWAAVIAAGGCATVTAHRAIALLGMGARLVELVASARKVEPLIRRMRLNFGI